MDVFQKLTIVTSVTSSVTLLIAALVLLPHIKSSVVIVRDVFLWVAFVLLLFGMGWFGWNRQVSRRPMTLDRVPSESMEASYQAQSDDPMFRHLRPGS